MMTKMIIKMVIMMIVMMMLSSCNSTNESIASASPPCSRMLEIVESVEVKLVTEVQAYVVPAILMLQ